MTRLIFLDLSRTASETSQAASKMVAQQIMHSYWDLINHN